jgi:hypothetical protein
MFEVKMKFLNIDEFHPRFIKIKALIFKIGGTKLHFFKNRGAKMFLSQIAL